MSDAHLIFSKGPPRGWKVFVAHTERVNDEAKATTVSLLLRNPGFATLVLQSQLRDRLLDPPADATDETFHYTVDGPTVGASPGWFDVVLKVFYKPSS